MGEACRDLEQVEDNIEMDFRGIGCVVVNWIEVIQGRV
jgi:hypothetical protein